jgi:hypothetical protein
VLLPLPFSAKRLAARIFVTGPWWIELHYPTGKSASRRTKPLVLPTTARHQAPFAFLSSVPCHIHGFRHKDSNRQMWSHFETVLPLSPRSIALHA